MSFEQPTALRGSAPTNNQDKSCVARMIHLITSNGAVLSQTTPVRNVLIAALFEDISNWTLSMEVSCCESVKQLSAVQGRSGKKKVTAKGTSIHKIVVNVIKDFLFILIILTTEIRFWSSYHLNVIWYGVSSHQPTNRDLCFWLPFLSHLNNT